VPFTRASEADFMSVEIFFRSVVRRWKQQIATATDRVIILSPYVTSNTAEAVVSTGRAQACELYTRFSLELFACGSSSIKTLKRLLLRGCSLYELPAVHAKVILVPGVFASIGSQNLTNGGSRNKEATTVLSEPNQLVTIRACVEQWVREARPIDMQMIEDMEAVLPPVVRQFRAARKAAEAAGRALQQAADDRAARQLREKQHQGQMQTRQRGQDGAHGTSARVTQLRTALSRLPRAPTTLTADVRRIDSTYSHVYSLLIRKGKLTTWNIAGRPLQLTSSYRYLCFLEDSGKLGWARVMNTRISFVARSVTKTQPADVGGVSCKIALSAVWDDELSTGVNVIVTLKPTATNAQLFLRCWYSVNALEIRSIVSAPEDALPADARRIRDFISEHSARFQQDILEELSRPFVYKDSQKLTGIEANTFFGPRDSAYRLYAAMNAGEPVLVAKELWLAGTPTALRNRSS
jgi:hypothetical protein